MKCYDKDIRPQIDELLSSYAGLKENTPLHNDTVILSGRISVNRMFNGFLVDKEYEIRIHIPLKDDNLPEVWDIGNSIDKSYTHRYPNGKLCLDTDAFIAFCFYKGFDLSQWMQNIVEPYFFSYEYYKRFGEYPLGERGHNLNGVVETYQQLFQEQDFVKVCKLLRAISERKYRGHMPCPCDSGIITRKCHGKYIYPFFSDEHLNAVANKDYLNICEAIEKNDKQQKY